MRLSLIHILLRTLRQTDRETRVLILSARGEVKDKVEGLDAGANDYLAKPFHLAELEARIRSLTLRQFTQDVYKRQSICVVTPEYDSNGQLLFRENLVPMIHGRNMLLLISTVNSGKTAQRALDCIQYYGGKTDVYKRQNTYWKPS